MSGQCWKLTSESGCQEPVEGSAPETVGFRLHTMWSGCNRVLTLTHSGTLGLQLKGHGQVGEQLWEVVDLAGQPWDPKAEEASPPEVKPAGLLTAKARQESRDEPAPDEEP